MAAITDLSDLLNRMTGGNNGTPETVFHFKTGRIGGAAAPATIAGRAASLWQYEGQPGGGATPTTAEIPTLSTLGAIPFTAPGGGRQKWLISAGVSSLAAGTFILYDRLFHVGGMNGTLTTDQTVQGSPASPALTRNTSGAGNFAFAEIYSLVGTTGTTITMTYTNQNGTSGQTGSVAFGGTGLREQSRAIRIPLASGDSGIRAVEKIRLTASTTTAGNFGITIAQPIAFLSCGAAGAMGWRDFTTGLPGIPEINSAACLALLFVPVTVTAPEIFGAFGFVEK